jgi:hypothetical protein
MGTLTDSSAQRGVRGIALHSLGLSSRRGWVVSTTPRPLYPRGRPGPILQEAEWAPGPVCTCTKNLAPTRIRSLDRPARIHSLYRLSYPGPFVTNTSQLMLHGKIRAFLGTVKNTKCAVWTERRSAYNRLMPNDL